MGFVLGHWSQPTKCEEKPKPKVLLQQIQCEDAHDPAHAGRTRFWRHALADSQN